MIGLLRKIGEGFDKAGGAKKVLKGVVGFV